MQTTPLQGENLLIYRKKTLQLGQGRKTPISYLSRIKNPKLLCLYVAAALQAYSYVLLLRYFKLLRNYYFLLQLIQSQGLLRPSQALLINYRMLIVIFRILTTPYILSLINYYYIYLTSPPLRPIKGVRGIYPFYYPNIKRRKRDIYIYVSKYLLYLGPSYQALAKGYYSLRGDRKTIRCYLGYQAVLSS